MRVVAVVNQKGGAGKTTTVMSLAAIAALNSKVLVVDTDPQRSVSMWAATAERPENKPLDFDVVSERDPNELVALRDTIYDTVFVDTPGNLENEKVLKTVVENSDFIIMPSEPTALSLLPLINTYRTIVEPVKKDYRVVLTRVDSRSLEDVSDAKDILQEEGILVCNAFVRTYKTHERAAIDGSVVTNYDNGRIAQKAAADYKDVALELFTSWASNKEK